MPAAQSDAPAWGDPITGHVHAAGMRCSDCRSALRPIPPEDGER